MKRFGVDDTLSPGPGQYKLPQSVNVKSPDKAFAGMSSQTIRKDS